MNIFSLYMILFNTTTPVLFLYNKVDFVHISLIHLDICKILHIDWFSKICLILLSGLFAPMSTYI